MLVVYIRYLKEKHSLPFNYHWGRNGQFSEGSDSFFGKTNYCRKRRKFRLQIYCLFANFYYHFIFELFGVCINIFKNTYNNIKNAQITAICAFLCGAVSWICKERSDGIAIAAQKAPIASRHFDNPANTIK